VTTTPRRTVISRHALPARRWQPESLFAAAAVAGAEEARQRRRRASEAQVNGTGPELLTPVQAARLLGVGRTTIYRLASERQLTRVRIGRSARFVRAELEEFIESRLAEARRQP